MNKIEEYLESKGYKKLVKLTNIMALPVTENIILPAFNLLSNNLNVYGIECKIEYPEINSIEFSIKTTIKSKYFYKLSLLNGIITATISKSNIYDEPEILGTTELNVNASEISEEDILNDFTNTLISFDFFDNI